MLNLCHKKNICPQYEPQISASFGRRHQNFVCIQRGAGQWTTGVEFSTLDTEKYLLAAG